MSRSVAKSGIEVIETDEGELQTFVTGRENNPIDTFLKWDFFFNVKGKMIDSSSKEFVLDGDGISSIRVSRSKNNSRLFVVSAHTNNGSEISQTSIFERDFSDLIDEVLRWKL